MEKEIQQPDIQIPSFDKSSRWALFPQIYNEWLRHICPQLGIDTEKMVLGHVLDCITSDDANIFAPLILRGNSLFDPQLASNNYKQMIARLSWEISTPEVPEEIKKGLEETRQTISQFEWSTFERFKEAKETWTATRDWVSQQIKETKDLRDAVDYYLEIKLNSLELAEYWKEKYEEMFNA